jgi:hypothetical protein
MVVIGNASTDFDDYYDGLAGKGPQREPPRKFLPESVRAFVDRVAHARPPGWREATGVCLDLSLPELAFVDATMHDMATEAAHAGPMGLVEGRVLLVGLDGHANASRVLTTLDAGDADPTFAVACRLAAEGGPVIVWAQYRKRYSFDLSDSERRALALAAESLDRAAGASRKRRGRGRRPRSGGDP